MNERIKELAEQAGGEFYEGFAGSTNFVKFAENDFEKFAELLVAECLSIVNDAERGGNNEEQQEFTPEQTNAPCPNCGTEHEDLCYHAGHGQYFCKICWDRETE